LETRDTRSFRLVFVADYFVNPQRYPYLPSQTNIYETLRNSGAGLVKMPEPDISPKSADGWVTITADQIEEYGKRGYRVFLLGVSSIKGGGVWREQLEEELRRRKVPLPVTILISPEQLSAPTESERLLRPILSQV